MLQRRKQRANGKSRDRPRPGGKRKSTILKTTKQALERSFEQDIRLGTERKMELANTLNLEPRQVVIWFQNKRARSKVKQLEEQYEILKSKFNTLQRDYSILMACNGQLEAEIVALQNRESSGSKPSSPEKETMGSVIKKGGDDDGNNCDVKLDTIASAATIDSTPCHYPPITESEYMSCSPLFGPPITGSVKPVVFRGSSSAAMEHQMLADESFMYMFSGEDHESLRWWAQHQQQKRQQGLLSCRPIQQGYNNQT